MNAKEKNLEDERSKLIEEREKLLAARNVPKPNKEQIDAHLSDTIAQAKKVSQMIIEQAGLKRPE
jgi:hypothetical protein